MRGHAAGVPTLPMPVTDAMFLLAESRNAPMHVGSLQLLTLPEGQSPREAARETYGRMLDPTGVRPIFAQRARRGLLTGGQWAWQRDTDIDLEHHVRRSALPDPGRPRELMELVGRLHSTLLDRSRPLWEAHLIEGLADGRFGIYTKMHHALADGVTALRLTQSSLSPDPARRDQQAPWAPRPARPTTAAALFASPRAVAAGALDLVRDLGGTVPAVAKIIYRGLAEQTTMLAFQAPRSLLNTSISGSRRFAAQSWPLDRLRALAQACGGTGGGTINDVVLAMSAGALRRYLLELGELPDAPLVAMVPVSLRTEGDTAAAGNAVGSLLCNLGTHLADPADRMATIQASIRQGKAELKGLTPTQVTLLSAGVMIPGFLGSQLRAHALLRPAYNLVISNVPGSRDDLYFNGARLDAMYPLSIPQEGQALNITVIGCGDRLGFGLVGCRRTLPRLQRMLTHLEDELVALEEAMA